jgi:hypothetical protein
MAKEITPELIMQKIEEYGEMFDDQFPSFQLPFMTDEELVTFIDKCLKEGKPAEEYYEIEDDAGVVY